ncbi:MAG: DNA repair protein RadA, partial [Acetobacteraceae bacterium]|nr:DNA repair protein RadA [Acetobacteraceae bacterium]
MASRPKRRFLCQSCGYESPRWMGRCPACGRWNTLVEELERPEPAAGRPRSSGAGPVPIAQVESCAPGRMDTGVEELDRVLGGGLVPGSLVLIGGEPGVGKSTLLLQVSNHVAALGRPVLYVSGEESAGQTKLRAERLGCLHPGLLVLAETDLDGVERHLRALRPALAVVDSIQTMYLPALSSAPGGVSQVRECAGVLLRLAKETGTAVVVVGHIAKSGALAGPKVLEHVVDAVLYFEGESGQGYRLLRPSKNRFGSTAEVGLLEMTESGLKAVDNPSAQLLAQSCPGVPGTVVAACLEGTRPFLVEVQALVCPSRLALPRRLAGGLDERRLHLILAVLERRLGLRLSDRDAYLRVTGGLRIEEPAVDLAVAVALVSAAQDRPVQGGTAVAGEVGLAGEVRSVGGLGLRVKEAGRMGFVRCIVPAWGLDRLGGGEQPELL